MYVKRHKFSPAHARLLDSQKRCGFLEPEKILKLVGVTKGMKAADIGAGSGFFTIPMAKMVGDNGIVFAIDVQEKMIAILNEKIRGLGIKNVKTLLSTEENIPLPSDTIDLAFMAQTLHELESYATIREIGRILKPLGALAILEWKKEAGIEMGPPAEERLTPEQTAEILGGEGFRLKKIFEDLKYHYLAIFAR